MISYNRNKEALEGSRMVFTRNYRNMNDYLTWYRVRSNHGKISARIKWSFEKMVLDEETGDERNWRLEAAHEPLESSEHQGYRSPTHSFTIDLRKGRCEIAVAAGFRRRTKEKDKKRNKIGGPKVKNVNICSSFVFSFGPI